jgi:hypothetical protein
MTDLGYQKRGANRAERVKYIDCKSFLAPEKRFILRVHLRDGDLSSIPVLHPHAWPQFVEQETV